MSATVPSGGSQTIGSGEVGFTEPLNVAGEYNIQGEFNFDGPVTGTFTAIRPLEVASGDALAVETATAGSPLNLAGELNLTGELKLTDSPSFTASGIIQPPRPGLISAQRSKVVVSLRPRGSSTPLSLSAHRPVVVRMAQSTMR